MEFFVVLLVIIVVAKVLGVSNFILILCGLGLIELVIIAMTLFFIYAIVMLCMTKRCEASFTKVDVPPKGKFKVAYYRIGEEEFPCIFPKETGPAGNIYKTDKVYKVWFSKSMKKVYDIWAVVTCFVGIIFSVSAIFITLGIINELRFML